MYNRTIPSPVPRSRLIMSRNFHLHHPMRCPMENLSPKKIPQNLLDHRCRHPAAWLLLPGRCRRSRLLPIFQWSTGHSTRSCPSPGWAQVRFRSSTCQTVRSMPDLTGSMTNPAKVTIRAPSIWPLTISLHSAAYQRYLYPPDQRPQWTASQQHLHAENKGRAGLPGGNRS